MSMLLMIHHLHQLKKQRWGKTKKKEAVVGICEIDAALS